MTLVKICGVRDVETANVAVEAGAGMVGLVFFADSPRHVDLEQAHDIARAVPQNVDVVGLMVDPTDFDLDVILTAADLSMIQLHGIETPERVADIRKKYQLPVMKALAVGSAGDLDRARAYEEAADWLLFDAKPEADAKLPGGNGVAFDWTLLAGRQWRKPWMLSGGLTPETVVEAIHVTGATAVDVSSGVEDKPGTKSFEKIRRFIAAARD
jgi:phosphoribosylanthranilate isomerase